MKPAIIAAMGSFLAFWCGRMTSPKVCPNPEVHGVCQTPHHHMPDGVWFGIRATNFPAQAHVIARIGGTNDIAPVSLNGAVGTWHDIRFHVDAMSTISMIQVTPRSTN